MEKNKQEVITLDEFSKELTGLSHIQLSKLMMDSNFVNADEYGGNSDNCYMGVDFAIDEKNETNGEFLKRVGMDGQKWAKEFMKKFCGDDKIQIDEDLIISWFCSAIMAGYDNANQKKLEEGTFMWAVEQGLKGKLLTCYYPLDDLKWVAHCWKMENGVFKSYGIDYKDNLFEQENILCDKHYLSTDWKIYEEQKFPINFKDKYINFLVYEDGSILINNIITHSMINIYDSLPLLEQAIKKAKELKK